MPNPFFYGGRVLPEQFVGRRAELRRIFACLETVHSGQMQSVSLVGPHRMGRSSLLHFIAHRFSDNLLQPAAYRLVEISGHNPVCRTPAGLLEFILRELAVPSLPTGAVDPLLFQREIRGLQANGVHVVVCLDEFEQLLENDGFDDSFFDCWRELMDKSEMAFVIASTRPLSHYLGVKRYTSSFFNIFATVELAEFPPTEAELLIDRGRRCDQPFTKKEIAYMRRLGALHPYRLQVSGGKIYEMRAAGEPVHRRELQRRVYRQLRQAGLRLERHRVFHDSVAGLGWFFQGLGRAVLALCKKPDEISDTTALWWGVAVTVAILGALVGIVGWGKIMDVCKFLFGKR